MTYGPVGALGGTRKDPTPTGTFSVDYKDADHVSNLYDADMPYSVFFAPAIAFHTGSLSERSHGCIHLGRTGVEARSSRTCRRATPCRWSPDSGERLRPMTEEQEYRIEHDTMGEVRVPAAALWAAQTQRAVENFPISGRPIEPAQIRALGLRQGRVRAGQQRPRRARRRPRATPSPPPRTRSRTGAHDDAVPDRRVPDRLGHQLEHERQRGHRDAGLPRARPQGPPERPRQRLAELQRRLPDDDPPRGHRGDRPRHGPALDHLGAVLNRKAQDWKHVVKAGPHPPHGRRADHPRPGGRRLGEPVQPRHRAPARDPAPPRRAADRRHRGGHRASTPRWASAAGRRAAPPGHRHPRALRGPRPHRGAGRPRRAGRGVRRAAHGRGEHLQDRQRRALDVVGPVDRPRRDPHPGPPAGHRRSCRARSTR